MSNVSVADSIEQLVTECSSVALAFGAATRAFAGDISAAVMGFSGEIPQVQARLGEMELELTSDNNCVVNMFANLPRPYWAPAATAVSQFACHQVEESMQAAQVRLQQYDLSGVPVVAAFQAKIDSVHDHAKELSKQWESIKQHGRVGRVHNLKNRCDLKQEMDSKLREASQEVEIARKADMAKEKYRSEAMGVIEGTGVQLTGIQARNSLVRLQLTNEVAKTNANTNTQREGEVMLEMPVRLEES